MNDPINRTASAGLADPLFQPVDAIALTDLHLTSLAAGTLAAVRIPQFMPRVDCERIAARLDAVPLDSYDAQRVDPPIMKFGPVLNDHRAPHGLAQGYWDQANAARAAWWRARLTPDPLVWSLERISAAWGRQVEAAAIDRRPVFAGTVREINSGALVHYDDVLREWSPWHPTGLFDQRVVAQLAFNLFLSVPTGGETRIWRRRWSPGDEARRNRYGYELDVVSDAQKVTVAPAVGDGLFFDPRHYHAVAASTGGRRIAVAFFLAITGTGSLIIWS